MRPKIGIVTAFDSDPADYMLKGSQLFYANVDYVKAVEAGGGVPVLVPLISNEDIRRELIENVLDGLVIIGGVRNLPGRLLQLPEVPGLKTQNPHRYDHDYSVIREGLRLEMPIMGMCRGHQMINEVTGGTLLNIPNKENHKQTSPPREPSHEITIEPGTLVHKITGCTRMAVNSLHIQAVDQPGEEMIASCRADDGVIEAIEDKNRPFVLGLQFHPERMIENPLYVQFFSHLARCAEEYRNHSKSKIYC